MGSGDWVSIAILWGITTAGAVWDIRSKTVPLRLLLVGAVALIVALLLPHEVTWWQRAVGLIPGAVMIGISFWKKMIGVGDAALVLLYGWGIGFRLLCIFLMLSFLCLLPAAIFFLTALHRSRRDTIPFYPFAAAGCAMLIAGLLW
ncbi:MAG: prepilin peptidase [Lachnospiraceae bacterium]|nr:prepilin peptidase [Lachnospiraceae bacterium]